MGSITITDVKKPDGTTGAEVSNVETANDWKQVQYLDQLAGPDWMASLFKNVTPGDGSYTLAELFDKIIDKPPADDEGAKTTLEKLGSLVKKLDELKKSIKELEAKKKGLPADASADDKKRISEQLELAKKLAAAIESEISDGTVQLEKGLEKSGKTDSGVSYSDDIKNDIKKFIQKHGTKSEKTGGYKASTPGDDEGAGKTGGTGGSKASTLDASNPYGIGKGYNIGGLGQNFNPLAMTMAQQLDDGLGGIIDLQGEQKKRQQMMMLFFYYARMAMSGDLGAMYQFMRFLTYVISRDKALQNVWMGTKLIQLQEVSRKATERLLNTKVDADDQQSQIEWQKELQKIRGEENMVATSQKLITQMMEEFAQITESLHNVTKAMLDANGSVNKTLSMIKT